MAYLIDEARVGEVAYLLSGDSVVGTVTGFAWDYDERGGWRGTAGGCSLHPDWIREEGYTEGRPVTIVLVIDDPAFSIHLPVGMCVVATYPDRETEDFTLIGIGDFHLEERYLLRRKIETPNP
ncbi:MAG: hypothetical protein M3Y37_03945 [Chloroflexota bacterium]|nr:hypothetical protein [Chloroflexota bacterium]